MDPDEMDDDQMMRLISVACAAVSGIASSTEGIITMAEKLRDYIETGKTLGQ